MKRSISANIPMYRPLNGFGIDIVQRQSGLSEVVNQIGQQHLNWQERQEGQEQPG